MKESHAITQPQPKLNQSHQAMTLSVSQKQNLLIALMIPSIMTVLNQSMFGVALPTIRDAFGIQADTTAWLVIVYTLPIMIFPPLYGRFGDGLGKQRLLLAGSAIFMVGTIMTLAAPNLALIMAGRLIQGFGAASVIPLSIAIISQYFPANNRGKALGTWNQIAPVMHMVGPILGGFLIDYLNWRLIFGPVLIVTIVVLWVVRTYIPPRQGKVQPHFFQTFDFGGLILLTAAITTLIFYVSSKSLTGVAVLQDWRLLGLTLVFFAGLIIWEKRHKTPFIALNILVHGTFRRASLCAASRMFAMSGIGFLLPLYLADIHKLSAISIGVTLTLIAGSLLLTLRIGGQLADRWSSRWPVTVGMVVQALAMVSFAVWPETTPIWAIRGSVILHGLGAGLSLAALHRASMGEIPEEQTGTAAGLYTLIRFGGTVSGPVVGGVVLQQGLDQLLLPIDAYQVVFWLLAGVVGIGVLLGWGLRE